MRAAPGSRGARLAACLTPGRGCEPGKGEGLRLRSCDERRELDGGACVCVSPSGVVKRWQRRARRGRSWGPSGAAVSGDGFPVTLGGVAAGADPGSRGWQGVRVTGWRPRGPAEPSGAEAGQLPAAAGKLVFSSLIVPEVGAAGRKPQPVRGLVVVYLVCVCVSASSFGVFISSSSFPGSCTD